MSMLHVTSKIFRLLNQLFTSLSIVFSPGNGDKNNRSYILFIFAILSRNKYLGRLVTSGNEISKDIAQRITSEWRRFGEYGQFLKNRRIPICLKSKIMDTVILPAMTYGAKTWALTKPQEKKLAVAQSSMGRLLLERQDSQWENKI